MTHHDDTTLPATDGPFMRAAAVLADLDGPFYAEERERDVWNEASAVGFQFFLWTIPVVAAAGLWAAGRNALPYVMGTLALWTLGALVPLLYASRLGVDPADHPLQGRRAIAYALLLVVLAGGLLRALLPVAGDASLPSLLRGSAQGGLVGVPIGLLGAVVGLRRDARRRARH